MLFQHVVYWVKKPLLYRVRCTEAPRAEYGDQVDEYRRHSNLRWKAILSCIKQLWQGRGRFCRVSHLEVCLWAPISSHKHCRPERQFPVEDPRYHDQHSHSNTADNPTHIVRVCYFKSHLGFARAMPSPVDHRYWVETGVFPQESLGILPKPNAAQFI